MTKKTNSAIEHRSFSLCEVKVAPMEEDGKEVVFSGYGAVFGNVDSYGDIISKGAFTDTIANAKKSGMWPAMLCQHGYDEGGMMPIGIWTDMKEDDHGLWVEGKLACTDRGEEIGELLKMTPRPALSGLSIGYRVIDAGPAPADSGAYRILKSVDVVEVSIVTFPANTEARVQGVKSDFDPRDVEEALRDAGLSRADSVKAVSVLKKMRRRDADEPGTGLRDGDNAAELRSLAERIRALSA